MNRESLALQEDLVTADPENVQTQFDMADAYANLGEALSALGDHRGAPAAIRRGISIAERAYARNPGYTPSRLAFANLHLTLGAALSKADATSSSLEAYRKAASLFEVEPLRSEAPALLAESHAGVGDAQAKLAGAAPEAARAAQWQAARKSYQQSLAIWVTLRDQGKLAPDEADRPKQIEQRIARCVAALAEGPR